MKWKTASGVVMSVEDMTTSHIRNSKKMLQRHLNDADLAISCCDELVVGSISYQAALDFSDSARKMISKFDDELSRRELGREV